MPTAANEIQVAPKAPPFGSRKAARTVLPSGAVSGVHFSGVTMPVRFHVGGAPQTDDLGAQAPDPKPHLPKTVGAALCVMHLFTINKKRHDLGA